jgi:hypothetical protein
MILNGENVIQPKKEKHLFCQLFSQKYEDKASVEGFYNQYGTETWSLPVSRKKGMSSCGRTPRS